MFDLQNLTRLKRRSLLSGLVGLSGASVSGCLRVVPGIGRGSFSGPGAEEVGLLWKTTLDHTTGTHLAATADSVVIPNGADITALNAATGATSWTTTLVRPRGLQVLDNTVFVHDDFSFISAVRLDTGNEQWRVDIGETFIDGLTVHDDRLYMAGRLYGKPPDVVIIDRPTKSVAGRVDFNQAAVSRVMAAGDQLVVGTAASPKTTESPFTDGHVRQFDRSLTTEQWAVRIGQRPRPVVVEDPPQVLVGGNVDQLTAIAPSDGTVAWQTPLNGPVSQPANDQSRVYVGGSDGSLYALDRGSGNQRWQFRPDAPATGSVKKMMTPVVHEDSVIAANKNGRLYAVDKTDGRLRWRFETGGGLRAPPTVRDGALYVAAQDTVYAIEI